MRHYKRVTIPERTEKQCYRITCDMCEATIILELLPKVDDIDAFKLTRSSGTAWPEGGSVVKTRIDLCAGCFEAIETILCSKGVAIQKEEIDF